MNPQLLKSKFNYIFKIKLFKEIKCKIDYNCFCMPFFKILYQIIVVF